MVLSILKAIAEGESKPTRLIYRCNLSYAIVQPIIRDLLEKGIFEVHMPKSHSPRFRRYQLTNKGLLINDLYTRLLKLLTEK